MSCSFLMAMMFLLLQWDIEEVTILELADSIT